MATYVPSSCFTSFFFFFFFSLAILALNQQSTGRGGAGNIRLPSSERVEGRGPEDYSDTRGRDPIPVRDLDEVIVCYPPRRPSAI